MTRYLTAADIAGFNASLVGAHALADFGLLESAVARPQTFVLGLGEAFPDLPSKAAALFHALIRNHPFVDGNKRTAVVALAVFLRINGSELTADDTTVVNLAVNTAEGVLTVDAIAGLLKDHTRPLDLPEA